MKRPAAVAFLFAVATLLQVASPSRVAAVETSSAPPLRISTVEDIATDLAALACDDESRYDAASRLFTRVGARPEDMSDFATKKVRNLVLRKAGASPETIVVGAHYDKTPRGCGAVDNWTGIVAMAHLYATLRDTASAKSLVFVAFDDEELGLLGSNAMVRSIPKTERARYCAMINLDSFERAMPQILDNASSRKLRLLATELAETMGMPFDHGRVEVADADSSSFVNRGVPAVTIHALSAEGLSILHTDEDQSSRVNPKSVYLGYRLALALLARVDASPCDAFR